MIIKSAVFIASNTDYKKCPKDIMPEYAFIGRSNVGKSSLINYLLKNKKLAKTSSTPGKTKLINHFLINENWFLVDLPGYGYAKISKKERDKWIAMIDNYLLKRRNLFMTFVLIDARHEPQKIDIEFIAKLGEHDLPFAIIFTKIDKISQQKLNENVELFKTKLLDTWEQLPEIFYSSSVDYTGDDKILNFIDSINIEITPLLSSLKEKQLQNKNN